MKLWRFDLVSWLTSTAESVGSMFPITFLGFRHHHTDWVVDFGLEMTFIPFAFKVNDWWNLQMLQTIFTHNGFCTKIVTPPNLAFISLSCGSHRPIDLFVKEAAIVEELRDLCTSESKCYTVAMSVPQSWKVLEWESIDKRHGLYHIR